MEVHTILAADYANITKGGKLNVMGIFRIIRASTFPATHPSMHLVIKFLADMGEYGETREMTVILTDQDGNELFRMNGPLDVPTPSEGTHHRPEINAILELKMLTFQRAGMHQFIVLVDKDRKRALPIEVVDTSVEKG